MFVCLGLQTFYTVKWVPTVKMWAYIGLYRPMSVKGLDRYRTLAVVWSQAITINRP